MPDRVLQVRKRRKGNRENIRAIQACNGRHITDSTDKANSLNSYYASVFGCKRNIAQIKITRSGEPFTINIKMIRKQLAAITGNNSMGPDGVPGEILKLGMEAMIPYHARLLGITISNAAIPSDWKRAIVDPIYKGGNRSVVTNYRPVSLTLLVCKQWNTS